MKVKITKLQTQEAKSVEEKLRSNNNYCPCSIIKSNDTKCMCKEFREATINCVCHCGLYKKEIIEE